jgi:IS1 family transposase
MRFVAMNRLDIATRAKILFMLCEGASMRSVSRLADVSINTVSKLLEDAGRFCAGFHDAKVRNVRAKRVQVDEIWSFTAAKQKDVATMKKPIDGAGDTWTWTAIEADTKLIISHFVGGRDGDCAAWFMQDVADRIDGRIQLTSDGHRAYLDAVEGAFGADIDYAMLVKLYGASSDSAKGRYSPAECIGARKERITGNPDKRHVSTSYSERANLTMRMSNRRFTRLTNAFSKKFENHAHMVAIYAVWYNWLRIHESLRVTPAMAAGLSKTVMDWSEIVEAADADAPAPKRSPYKKPSPNENPQPKPGGC